MSVQLFNYDTNETTPTWPLLQQVRHLLLLSDQELVSPQMQLSLLFTAS